MAKNGSNEEAAPVPEGAAEEGADFKYIVRIANTDLDGNRTAEMGLTGLAGVGRRMARVICTDAGLDRTRKLGDLSDEEVDLLETTVMSIADTTPDWMLNRRKDLDTGKNMHVVSSEVKLMRQEDINIMKKIRSYKGVRHESGHKVRGQRTSSNGRRGLTLGVTRKKR